jgi:hypothetical protein
MVGVVGFEPTAPYTPCKCATGLRYTPSVERITYMNWPFKQKYSNSSEI